MRISGRSMNKGKRKAPSHTEMTYAQLQAEVRRGKLSSLYLLAGEEAFQREEALSLIIQTAVDEATKDFNFDLFYSDDFDPEAFLNAALSLPMMAERRMVVLKSCEKISDGVAGKFLSLVSNPPESTCMVFTGSKVNLKRKLFAAMKDKGVVVAFKPLYDDQIPGWIQTRVRGKEKEIAPDALRLLHDSVGNNLGEIASEIEKLCAFLDERKAIRREDVEQVVGVSREYNAFELADAVGRRKRREALIILKKMLERGERATWILRALVRHLILLSKTQKLQRAGLSRSELAKRLKVHPYFLNEYLTQSRSFPSHDLAQGLGLLLEAEDHLKSGYQKEQIVMELLIYRLCR